MIKKSILKCTLRNIKYVLWKNLQFKYIFRKSKIKILIYRLIQFKFMGCRMDSPDFSWYAWAKLCYIATLRSLRQYCFMLCLYPIWLITFFLCLIVLFNLLHHFGLVIIPKIGLFPFVSTCWTGSAHDL